VIDFTVLGQPVPWKRARQRKDGRRYTDERHAAHAEAIRTVAQSARPKLQPLPVPMALRVVVYLPLAAGYSLPVNKKSGDHDNYGKLVADALEGIAYENDSQIIDGQEIKLAAGNDEPRTRIIVGVAGEIPVLEVAP
jgi:Holliday junction resolvase RusA-like endonuclease